MTPLCCLRLVDCPCGRGKSFASGEAGTYSFGMKLIRILGSMLLAVSLSAAEKFKTTKGDAVITPINHATLVIE